MFPSQSASKIGLSKLKQYVAQTNPDDYLNKTIVHLEKAAELFDEYHTLFLSIQWNQSRKAIRQKTESKLKAIATETLKQIEAAGKLLDSYSQSNEVELPQWNEIIVALIKARTWLITNHLNDRQETKTAQPKAQVEVTKPISVAPTLQAQTPAPDKLKAKQFVAEVSSVKETVSRSRQLSLF